MPERAVESGPAGGWQRLHPLTPALRSIQLLIPLALTGAFALGSGDEATTWVAVALAAVLLVGVSGIVLSYLRYRYRVTDEDLVIVHGVLFRQRRVIPRSRIQNIDLQAGPLQQILRVVSARVETAGGGATEASLQFVSRPEGARLRQQLVPAARPRTDPAIPGSDAPTREGRPASAAEHVPEVGPAPEAGVEAERLEAFRYADEGVAAAGAAPGTMRRSRTVWDLVLAGATANRAGVIFGALFGGDFLFGIAPTDWLLRRWLPPELVEPETTGLEIVMRSAEQGVESLFATLWLMGVMFAIAGWAVSVLASVLQYYGFTLTVRPAGEMEVSYGLLTRHEKSFRRARVQNVQIHESLIRRWFGLSALTAQTAGYGPEMKSEQRIETLTPLARAGELPDYLRAVYPDLDWRQLEWRPAHPLARRRLFVRRAVPIAVGGLVLAGFVGPGGLLLLLGLAPAWVLAGLHYRQLGHARIDPYVLTREGFWTRRVYIVPLRKIQALHVTQTPFQRRLRLATTAVSTAGDSRADMGFGGAGGPGPRALDLDRTYAARLADDLTTRVAATGLTF